MKSLPLRLVYKLYVGGATCSCENREKSICQVVDLLAKLRYTIINAWPCKIIGGIYMSFGKNLQHLRRMCGDITQEVLAEKLKVSRQTVSKWELDESTPEMDKAI